MKTIAVIFGGKSAEHDVSIITAHIPIIASLLVSGQFDVWPVYIATDGSWYADKAMSNLGFFKQEGWEKKVKGMKKIHLAFDKGLQIVWPGLLPKKVSIDIVFPAMHGTYGEDGSLMGLLRMAGVPFVGCDIFASTVAMDKVLTKQVVAAEGMPVVPYVWFTKSEWEEDRAAILARANTLSMPLFVKPVHLGSSIGMAKAKNDRELENAIEVALHYDDKVLVEQAIEPLLEITLPIMGNDEPRVAHCERPLNKTEFFDFKDKYLSGGKNPSTSSGSSKGGGGANVGYSEVPAKIGDELTSKIKELGKRVYKTLGCSGIARVDFLVKEDTREVFVNEVNTLPGSLYHHNWKKAGVSNMELVLGLVKLAEERFAHAKGTTYTFESDILRKVGGPKAQ